MLRVAEKHKVRRFVDAARRDISIGHIDMTDAAFLHSGEARQISAHGLLVACDAL
jgi:hypothetical protein